MDRQKSICREQRRNPLDQQRVGQRALYQGQTCMSGMICEGSTMMPRFIQTPTTDMAITGRLGGEQVGPFVHTGLKSKKNVASNH